MHTSQPIPGTIEFLDITSINPLISKCKVKVCYVGDTPNRNRSIITEDTAKIIAKSLPGSPIVGYYNEEKGDFEEHNRYFTFKNGKLQMKTNTRPYGFVDVNAKVWFEEYLDDFSDRRKYLVTEGYIWTGQYPESKSIIENGGRPHSLEFEEDKYLDAFWTKDGNGNNQFFIINEAVIANLCVLGKDVEPCFEGSSVTQFSLDPDFKTTIFSLIKDMKDILENKGGLTMTEENKIVQGENIADEPVIDTPVVEEPVVDAPVTEEPIIDTPVTDYQKEKDNADKDANDDKKDTDDVKEDDDKKKSKYSLEEIPEYVALQADYEDLSTKYSALEASVKELTEYRANIEKKEKEALIKSFYMLSDEDKQDVVKNIATYSYDEIKSKLSVICVDKRVSFEKEDTTSDKKEAKTALTYNLEDCSQSNSSDSGKPAWLKRVDRQIKK